MNVIDKLYAGESLTKKELEKFVWLEFDKNGHIVKEIAEIEGDKGRWTCQMRTIIQIDNDLWEIDWDQGLTKYQENQYFDQPYRVVRKERTVVAVYYERLEL